MVNAMHATRNRLLKVDQILVCSQTSSIVDVIKTFSIYDGIGPLYLKGKKDLIIVKSYFAVVTSPFSLGYFYAREDVFCRNTKY